MCGIAGFIDTGRSRDNATQRVNNMCEVIRHRGPDDQGVWIGDGVALGMRCLSIIDLSGGRQPIFNENESLLVVFNGEICNYHDLQKALLQIPITNWFHCDLVSYAYDLLNSPRARQRGSFNSHFIHDLLKALINNKLVNYSQEIWALLCLELWFQVYMDTSFVPIGRSVQINRSIQRYVTSD